MYTNCSIPTVMLSSYSKNSTINYWFSTIVTIILTTIMINSEKKEWSQRIFLPLLQPGRVARAALKNINSKQIFLRRSNFLLHFHPSNSQHSTIVGRGPIFTRPRKASYFTGIYVGSSRKSIAPVCTPRLLCIPVKCGWEWVLIDRVVLDCSFSGNNSLHAFLRTEWGTVHSPRPDFIL